MYAQQSEGPKGDKEMVGASQMKQLLLKSELRLALQLFRHLVTEKQTWEGIISSKFQLLMIRVFVAPQSFPCPGM